MPHTIRLIDPAGHTQAVLPAPASAEQLLRAAFDLQPEDSLVVCMTDADAWSLAILKAGVNLVPVGPAIHELSRSRWETTRLAMVETTWLDLVDAGWAVVFSETAADSLSRT